MRSPGLPSWSRALARRVARSCNWPNVISRSPSTSATRSGVLPALRAMISPSSTGVSPFASPWRVETQPHNMTWWLAYNLTNNLTLASTCPRVTLAGTRGSCQGDSSSQGGFAVITKQGRSGRLNPFSMDDIEPRRAGRPALHQPSVLARRHAAVDDGGQAGPARPWSSWAASGSPTSSSGTARPASPAGCGRRGWSGATAWPSASPTATTGPTPSGASSWPVPSRCRSTPASPSPKWSTWSATRAAGWCSSRARRCPTASRSWSTTPRQPTWPPSSTRAARPASPRAR